jgi:hypothetical protein
MALETELATFDRLLPQLVAEEGKFAVIRADALIGVFDTYQDALKAGYEKAGLEPFLVKQIAAFPVVANFTRDFGACTLQT